MTIDFYYTENSPSCRSVQMTADAVGVKLNPKEIDFAGGEHLGSAFLEMNPQHTVPTINDVGEIVWESRAIMGYLVNKYGKDDKLYPKNPMKRAMVDQRLYFDAATMSPRICDYFHVHSKLHNKGGPEKLKKVEEAFEFFNAFLEGHKYAAGDHITIADFALLATVAMAVDGGPKFPLIKYPNEDVGPKFSLAKYPNVERWHEDCKKNVHEGNENSTTGLEFMKKNVHEGNESSTTGLEFIKKLVGLD